MREGAPPMPPQRNTKAGGGAVAWELRRGRACAIISTKTSSGMRSRQLLLLGRSLKQSREGTGTSRRSFGRRSAVSRSTSPKGSAIRREIAGCGSKRRAGHSTNRRQRCAWPSLGVTCRRKPLWGCSKACIGSAGGFLVSRGTSRDYACVGMGERRTPGVGSVRRRSGRGRRRYSSCWCETRQFTGRSRKPSRHRKS
jgi:hypothetical protein